MQDDDDDNNNVHNDENIDVDDDADGDNGDDRYRRKIGALGEVHIVQAPQPATLPVQDG